MFLKTKPAPKTPVEQLQAKVRDQGLELAKQVGPAAGAAVVTAKAAVDGAKEWATPHVEAARDWAQPHLEKGQDAAAPHLAAASAAVAPAVEAARVKIVDDVLPRLVEAVQQASTTAQTAAAPAVAAAGTTAAAVGTKAATAGTKAATAAAAKATAAGTKAAAAGTRAAATTAAATAGVAGVAKSRSSDALAVLKGEAVVKPKRRGRKVLLVALVIGLGAAAFSALRKRDDEDPWATPGATWTPTPSATTPAPAEPAEGSTVVLEDAAGEQQGGGHVADGDTPAS